MGASVTFTTRKTSGTGRGHLLVFNKPLSINLHYVLCSPIVFYSLHRHSGVDYGSRCDCEVGGLVVLNSHVRMLQARLRIKTRLYVNVENITPECTATLNG